MRQARNGANGRLPNQRHDNYSLTVTPSSGFQVHGAIEAAIKVTSGEKAAACTFTLQAKAGNSDGRAIFLPSVRKP